MKCTKFALIAIDVEFCARKVAIAGFTFFFVYALSPSFDLSATQLEEELKKCTERFSQHAAQLGRMAKTSRKLDF